jgi:hypothetical protein
MYLARVVFPEPENLDHKSLLFFPFGCIDVRCIFSTFNVDFHPSRMNRENLNTSFMNGINILYDDRDKIGIKPPDAEL